MAALATRSEIREHGRGFELVPPPPKSPAMQRKPWLPTLPRFSQRHGRGLILRAEAIHKGISSECADATIERLTSRQLQNSSTRQRRRTSRCRPATTSHPAQFSPLFARPAIRAHASSPACVGGWSASAPLAPTPNAPPSMLAPTTSSAAASGAPRCISAAAWSRSRVSLSGASPTRRRSDSHSTINRCMPSPAMGRLEGARRPLASEFLDYHRGGQPGDALDP